MLGKLASGEGAAGGVPGEFLARLRHRGVADQHHLREASGPGEGTRGRSSLQAGVDVLVPVRGHLSDVRQRGRGTAVLEHDGRRFVVVDREEPSLRAFHHAALEGLLAD